MTQEQTLDASPPREGEDDELQKRVEKRNQALDVYYEKQANLAAIADQIRELLGASGTGLDEVLSTMSDIESRLESIDELFVELGRVPDGGNYFDAGYYQHVMLERAIANRKIRELDEIPEAFRTSFQHLFDQDSQNQGRWPRDTDAIRDDLSYDLEELRYMLARVDDFSDYMPEGRTKMPPKLETLRDKLNALWDEFKSLAKAIAYHF